MASSGNFSTLHPSVCGYANLTDGNVRATGTSNSGAGYFQSTFGVSSGKWYAEMYVITMAYSHPSLGLTGGTQVNTLNTNTGMEPNLIWYGGNASNKLVETSMTNDVWGTYSENESSVSTISATNLVMIALDADNKKLWYGVGGTWYNSGDPAANDGNWAQSWTTNPDFIHLSFGSYNLGDLVVNFGQDSTFGGRVTAGGNADGNGFGDFKYSPPTGFLALCSGNLPISDDIDPAQTDDDYPGKQFSTVLYSGTGSAQSIDAGLQADLVWAKSRGSQSNRLADSTRGSAVLFSDTTDAHDTTAGISFDSDGFNWTNTDGSNANDSGANYVAWCWKANGGTTSTNSDGSTDSTVQANTKAGFSIVQTPNYSGTPTFGHGLTKALDFIIVKLITSAAQWIVYHSGLSSAGKILYLNQSAAEATNAAFNSTAPTNQVFSLGGGFAGSGTAIAYCWHSVEGYSKFGKFEGNANNDGPFIYTGFRPRMLFIKNTESASPWCVYDGARPGFNPSYLVGWDESTAENTSSYPIDILSNGFKLRTSNATINSAHTWVYGAWGDVPFKYNNTF